MLKKIYYLFVFYFQGGVKYAKAIGVSIGKDCRIITKHFGTEPFLITIGDRVTVTDGVRFLTHDGSLWLFRDSKGRRFKYQRIKVGNDVFIGVNSVIMPGVVIEDEVIIAAGAIVTKSIPSGVIVAGNPAKIIGNYSDFKNKCLKEQCSQADFKKGVSFRSNILSLTEEFIKPFLVK